jgi:arylformamidase
MGNRIVTLGAWAMVVSVAIAIAHCSTPKHSPTSPAEGDSEMSGPEEMRDSNSGGPVVLPHEARVNRDLAYGPDPAQRLDVYLPRDPHGAPVLFMVHGGAWMFGDKGRNPVVGNKIARWLPKGYIVVAINYRMLPPDPIRQTNDVALALAFVQANAATWGGDPERLVVMGHSAGAHLVALLASDPAIGKAQGVRPWLGTVALDTAAFDVEQIMRRRHYRFYDRVFKNDPAYWRSTSPIHRLSVAPFPLLTVCSSERDNSCAQAQAFAAKVAALGGRIEVLPIAKSHEEINDHLGLPGPYTDAVESFMRSLGMP